MEAQEAPEPVHQSEVQLVGAHGHVRSLELAALVLDPDALVGALGHGQQHDVQVGGAPKVDPHLDGGGLHHLGLVAHALGQSAGVGELDRGPLLYLSAADGLDPGVLTNGPSPELLPLGGGLNLDPQSEGVLGPLLGEIVLHHGPENTPNHVRCLEDSDQNPTHLCLVKGGLSLPRKAKEDQNLNPSLGA